MVQVSLTSGDAFPFKIDAKDPGCDLQVHLIAGQRDAQAFLRGFASNDLVDGVEWVMETPLILNPSEVVRLRYLRSSA